jgi:hypothetical protein
MHSHAKLAHNRILIDGAWYCNPSYETRMCDAFGEKSTVEENIYSSEHTA